MTPDDWKKGMENEAASVGDGQWAAETRGVVTRRVLWSPTTLLPPTLGILGNVAHNLWLDRFPEGVPVSQSGYDISLMISALGLVLLALPAFLAARRGLYWNSLWVLQLQAVGFIALSFTYPFFLQGVNVSSQTVTSMAAATAVSGLLIPTLGFVIGILTRRITRNGRRFA